MTNCAHIPGTAAVGLSVCDRLFEQVLRDQSVCMSVVSCIRSAFHSITITCACMHHCLSSSLGPLQAAARLDRSSREGAVRRGLCIPPSADWPALLSSSLVSQVAKSPALGPGRSGGLPTNVDAIRSVLLHWCAYRQGQFSLTLTQGKRVFEILYSSPQHLSRQFTTLVGVSWLRRRALDSTSWEKKRGSRCR
jgi:hypothetical protein